MRVILLKIPWVLSSSRILSKRFSMAARTSVMLGPTMGISSGEKPYMPYAGLLSIT